MVTLGGTYVTIMLFLYPVVAAMAFSVMTYYGRWTALIFPVCIQRLDKTRKWHPSEWIRTFGECFIIVGVLLAATAMAYDTSIALTKIITQEWFREFFIEYFQGGAEFVERLVWQIIKIGALISCMAYRLHVLSPDERKKECHNFWLTTGFLALFYCVVVLELTFDVFGWFIPVVGPSLPHF